MRAITAVVSLVLALAACRQSAPPPAPAPAGDTMIAPDPALRTGRLDNGLRYFVKKNRRPEGRAELRLVVRAGSILEDEDQRGLAHVLEHMAFNGTERFPSTTLIGFLQAIGVEFGTHLNASTGFDETVYMLQVPTASRQVLRTAIEVMSDWANRVTLTDEEIEKERGVILEEWRSSLSAGRRVFDEVFERSLAGSRYPERMPIGTEDSLRTFTPEQLRRFYREWYRPDLMGVIAVGDFEPREVEAMIREVFSPLTNPPAARPRPQYTIPITGTPRVAVVTDPEMPATMVTVAVYRADREESTVESYRRLLAERVVLVALDERLGDLASGGERPFLGGESSVNRFNATTSEVRVQAMAREGNAVAALEALLTEIERMQRHGPEPHAIERAKASMFRAMESYRREADKNDSDSFADELRRAFVWGEPVPGVEGEWELQRRLLPEVTPEELKTAAAALFAEAGRVVSVVAPEKEGLRLPSEEELRAVLARVVTAPIPPLEASAVGELMSHLPDPGRVVEERELGRLGVLEWRLSNGARVIVKPTRFKEDEVLMRAVSWGGTSLAADGEFISAFAAPGIVMQSGLGEHDATDLPKLVSGRRASVMPWVQQTQEGLNGIAAPDDIELMLQLAHLTMSAPRFEPQGLEGFRELLTQLVQNRARSPELHFEDAADAALWRGDRRMRPPRPEELREMRLEDAAAFYRDRFSDADDFVFVFVGNVDAQKLRPLVERYLASLPSRPGADTVVDRGIAAPSRTVEERVVQGVEPKAMVKLVFSKDVATTPRDRRLLRLVLENASDLMREELRENLSGTYGAVIDEQIELRPKPRVLVTVEFGCEPSRVDELTQGALAILRQVQAEAPGPGRVAQLKVTAKRRHERNLRENTYWLSALAGAYVRGEDPAELLEVGAEMDALTPEALLEVATRLVDLSRYVKTVLVPEAGVGIGAR